MIVPVRETEYKVYDSADDNEWRFDYTSALPLMITVSVMADASGIESSFANGATGALFIHNYQVRGTALVRYDAQEVRYESASSIAAYGVRSLSINLTLSQDRPFADALARWLLEQYKTPQYRVRAITFNTVEVVNGVNLFALEIGDIITLSEDQTGVDAQRYIILGIRLALADGGRSHSLTFALGLLGPTTYWQVQRAGYSELGQTTILAPF